MNIPPWNPAIRRKLSSIDRTSKEGTENTARDIVHIWRAHGYDTVTAEVYPIAPSREARCERLYGVKLNLIGALPPRTA